MTNSTRQQIIDAYDALEELRANALEQEGMRANDQYRAVLEALPPKPDLTMADVEWDDDKHYLAEAEHAIWGKVIMLFRDVDEGNIFVKTQSKEDQRFVYGTPEYLTPTGKRYTLAAADQPEGKA